MMLHWFRKTYVTLFIFFVVIAFHSPIYHQHVDDHHPDPLTHTDNIASHNPNDYSANSHKTGFLNEVLPDESHQAHFHAHFEKEFYTTSRIVTKKVKTIYSNAYEAFSSLSTNNLALNKYSYDYYQPQYYSNDFSKTSSGLSPPRISI